MANEMLAAAAARGGTGSSPAQIARRMYDFYLSRGMDSDAALEQVDRLMSSGMYSDVAERRAGVQDRAMELARRAEDQARMRANPQMLGEGIAAPAPADLPGYDPTARAAHLPLNELLSERERVMRNPSPQAAREFNRQIYELSDYTKNRPQIPSFSQPMTQTEAEEARVTRPMVQDTRPAWLRERAAAPSMSPLISRPESGFLSARLGQPGYNARVAEYEAQKRAYNIARGATSGPAQTYVPAAQGQPILNAGEEPPRTMGLPAPAGLIGAAAAAPAAAVPASAAPAAAAPAANGPMSAAFLDGPSAFRQMAPMMATPEAMRLPTSYGQPERRAVQVAREVVGANAPPPPPRPVEVSRPAVEPSARALWTRYNESESPADFVRADRLGRAEGGGIPEGMMGARPMPSLDLPPMDGPPPMSDMPPLGGMSPTSKPTGGAGAGGRDAAINKALEIIHHLVIRGR
jgi:hypothetical protein